MEIDFARDLGVGVGDTLRFDIQGVPVEGRIVNLRSVDWNSMQPNFFVSLQPGVIEAAPAVFLASIPSLPADDRNRLQAAIVEAFPNVSVIDMIRIVTRATSLIDQLEWALGATTITTVLVGFFLVVAIARDEARARRADINLLKILGARHSLLRRSVSAEFALLAISAAGAGVALAVTIGAVLAYRFLDTALVTAWWPLVATLVAVPTLSVITARLATRRVLWERPSLAR
jgi:putative ABC transport system permease protein